jgi:hypothetical protein
MRIPATFLALAVLGLSAASAAPRKPATADSDFANIRAMTHGAEPAQIACTRGGCQAVPRGCLREPERAFDGSASGFDRIVCPPR